MIELLILAVLVPAVLTKVVQDNRTDRAYAEKGMVSPRYQERLTRLEQAGRKNERATATERGPLRAYLSELWADAILDLQDKHRSRREQRGPAVYDPNRPSVAQRFDRAVLDGIERIKASKGWDTTKAAAKTAAAAAKRRLVDPVGEKPPAKPEPAAAEPEPATPAATEEKPASASTEPETPIEDPDITPAAAAATEPPGGTMTAPTGEAVNYETTVAELEALAREQRGHLDSCAAALKAIEQAKASINDMQESYRASAAAAASMSEHLSSLHLDGVTLANAGTTVDAMPAGKIDAIYDQLEGMEVEAKARYDDAEKALGATEGNLAHVQATYSAAHETVAAQLGGDSSFLNSGGAGGGGQVVTTGPVAGGGGHEDGFGRYGSGELGTVDKAKSMGWSYGDLDSMTARYGADGTRERVDAGYARGEAGAGTGE